MDTDSGNEKEIRILVAEDNLLNQKLIETYLIKNNFKVITARNGEEACTAHKSEKPDLILMDVEMPILNGYEAVLRIRETEKGTNTRLPIIALTGHYLQEDIDNVYKCGMDDYIQKPINFEKFKEKILSFLKIKN